MIRLLDLLTGHMSRILRFLNPTPPQQKKGGGVFLIFSIIRHKEEM